MASCQVGLVPVAVPLGGLRGLCVAVTERLHVRQLVLWLRGSTHRRIALRLHLRARTLTVGQLGLELRDSLIFLE